LRAFLICLDATNPPTTGATSKTTAGKAPRKSPKKGKRVPEIHYPKGPSKIGGLSKKDIWGVKYIPRKLVVHSQRRRPSTPYCRNTNNLDNWLHEIRYIQKTPALLIPRLPFSQVIREICGQFAGPGDTLRIQSVALVALQEASEAMLTMWFEML